MAENTPERRKNPARRREATTPALIYLVEVDTATARWNISRDGKLTGDFASNRNTAIGTATHKASLEAHETSSKVEVWSVDGTKRTKEWPQ